MTDLNAMGLSARHASYQLAELTAPQKNALLNTLADELEKNSPAILAANAKDIEQGKANGLTEALIDRLLLTEERLSAIASDVRMVARLEDPVGEEFDAKILENGLRLRKRRVPVGVLGVIYEARPNVTIDVAALSLKTGNACILRGGKETTQSNAAVTQIIQSVLKQHGVDAAAVQSINDPDRALVAQLLKLDAYVDMIIPRGGKGLHKLCIEQATIPVITGGIGICHLFVDESADLSGSVKIVENAKVQRPSVCNSLDTVLVHEAVAAEFLPQLADELAKSAVSLRLDPASQVILANHSIDSQAAQAEDFDQEWLSLVLSVKVVADLDEAVSHIRQHSTQHSDGILTSTLSAANRFVNSVNSAAVYVNASTRFTDGAQFGLGAEVAVSTQKLHARGPMGLSELTTYKWIGEGDMLARS
ncbi:glutamate-5-semialdehyde dehydrogenase [Echinimonas agarilytica]|uniref:Gamma-glutamyl phosphate reductase n=1 Tax=Echinimonas agarilytica TaxID=1215918 RepID=A0AA41W8B1_9GAMM|nr:glutamate-5-semialdehyde dehydrogenase [Echinimonas agarilytica]MCM2680253.1 glutamate-5-semialdehyde dehydrogenase [Echinimonas agarilytica]